ncbi:uncharacterized protein [Cherax quadricarinatus]|uniref:uncharacterized protein isoform X3 n=1 Tax=Cherax quadricarinatus TaxID=27406 RepID=UPI00387E4DB0
MDKGSHRLHERRRKIAEKSKDSKGKSKRSTKNEGSIMQEEVQRYKDKEKSLQNEEGPMVSNRRMTIHQGIYSHGCSSGTVHREIGLNKETKARAEANLSRILELASYASLEKQASKASLTTHSPHRSFLTKKVKNLSSSPKQNVGASPGKRKADISPLRLSSSESDDIYDSISSQPKKHEADNSCQKTEGLTNVASPTEMEKESKTKELNHQRSKKSKTAHKKCSDRLETKENDSPEIKQRLFESLTAAIKDSLEEKAKLLTGTRDLRLEIFKKIHEKYDECAEDRISYEGTGSSSLVLVSQNDNGMSKRPANSGDDQNKNRKAVPIFSVMKTPSSTEYLKLSQGLELPHHHKGEMSEPQPSMNISLCPGTTIVSPCALLRRYEMTLQNRAPKCLSGKVDLTDTSHQCTSLCDLKSSDDNSGAITSKSDSVFLEDSRKDLTVCHKENILENKIPSLLQGNKSGYPERLENVTPLLKSVCDSECPQTVVVDALHFLEKCEKQSKLPQMRDTNPSKEDSSLHCTFTKDCIPQNINNIGSEIISHSSLEGIFDLPTNIRTNCVYEKKGSLKGKDYGENLFPHPECRGKEENISKSIFPVVNTSNAGRERIKMVAEIPLSQSNLTLDSSIGPLLSSSVGAASSTLSHFPSECQPFPPACCCASYEQPSNPKYQLTSREEQVLGLAVDKYSHPSGQFKQVGHVTAPTLCLFNKEDASLDTSMNLHMTQNVKPNVVANESVFPVSYLDTKQPTWRTRHQDFSPSSPVPCERHPTRSSFPNAVKCSGVCCSASGHTDYIGSQNLHSMSAVPLKKHPQLSRYPYDLPEDPIFERSSEMTQRCHQQISLWPRISDQPRTSRAHTSASVSHSIGCCCERYSNNRTCQNPKDVFREHTHCQPSHQDNNICVGVQDWVDASSNTGARLPHFHHTGTHKLPQVLVFHQSMAYVQSRMNADHCPPGE